MRRMETSRLEASGHPNNHDNIALGRAARLRIALSSHTFAALSGLLVLRAALRSSRSRLRRQRGSQKTRPCWSRTARCRQTRHPQCVQAVTHLVGLRIVRHPPLCVDPALLGWQSSRRCRLLHPASGSAIIAVKVGIEFRQELLLTGIGVRRIPQVITRQGLAATTRLRFVPPCVVVVASRPRLGAENVGVESVRHARGRLDAAWR